MIRYQVRSKELIDLVNEIKYKRLIISPYFQRNLVWRNIHKVDFIKTILMGLPFPQIFIAKGSIDLETMKTTSCIVDGQQRMSTITEYVNSLFPVDGKYFKDLPPEKMEEILKYQVPIIDLDINNDSNEIKEIFQRLNRTFYSLNSVEKLATEYASSDFMLFAKHLTGEITFDDEESDSSLSVDPTIPQEFIDWASTNKVNYFKKLIVEGPVFTPYEISRQTHLMYTLNLLATYMGGIYTRNELVNRYLNDHKESFPERNETLLAFEETAKFISSLELEKDSYWYNKANMFSLFIYILSKKEFINEKYKNAIKEKLEEFASNAPDDYRISAKEGVNNRKERLLRNDYINKMLNEIIS